MPKREPQPKPMRCSFQNVTEDIETVLRGAGFLPVLRWVRIGQHGTVSSVALKTGHALRALRYAEMAKARRAKAKRSAAAKRGIVARKAHRRRR